MATSRYLRSVYLFLISAGLAIGGAPESTVQIQRLQYGGMPLPRYGYGITVAFDRSAALVAAYDREGRETMKMPLHLVGADSITIHDAAAGPNQKVAVAAGVSDRQGHAASVIFFCTASGSLSQVVRTSPFVPSHIIFGADGTLWATGRLHDENKDDVPVHDILRQYAADGGLMRTMLSSATFPGYQLHPGMESFLVAGVDRVGIYSRPTDEYVEYSLEGKTLGRWRLPPLDRNLTLQGVAMLPSGKVYFSAIDSFSMRVYLFDRESGTRATVPFAPPDEASGVKPATILGNDSDRLVLYAKNQVWRYRFE